MRTYQFEDGIAPFGTKLTVRLLARIGLNELKRLLLKPALTTRHRRAPATEKQVMHINPGTGNRRKILDRRGANLVFVLPLRHSLDACDLGELGLIHADPLTLFSQAQAKPRRNHLHLFCHVRKSLKRSTQTHTCVLDFDYVYSSCGIQMVNVWI